MTAKETALRKIETLLSMGRPEGEATEAVAGAIAPERMARLKARCSAIAPFRQEISDDDLKVVVLAKAQGMVFAVRRGPKAESEKFRKIMDDLAREGFVHSSTDAPKSSGPGASFALTQAGQQFLERRMKDPRTAELLKQFSSTSPKKH